MTVGLSLQANTLVVEWVRNLRSTVGWVPRVTWQEARQPINQVYENISIKHFYAKSAQKQEKVEETVYRYILHLQNYSYW